MTDIAQDVQGSASPSPSETVASAPQNAAPTERLFRQSEVNELIGRVKNEAVERFKRESSMSSHSENNSQNPRAENNSSQPPARDDIRRMVAEETERAQKELKEQQERYKNEQDAHRIASEFFQRIDAGKGKYEDFDNVMGDLNLGNIPNTVALATQFENTADIMYELSKNPSKIANLEYLMHMDPKLALSEMKRISNSIKTNQEAANFNAPPEPLSQMRPTSAGAGKTGPLSPADYRRRYKV